MNEIGLAHEAYTLSKQNERDISAHEDLCAERYGNIHHAIADIKGILKWAGTSAFAVIIGLLGWSISQQMAANKDAALASQTKLELLQRQIIDARPATSLIEGTKH